jgi:hypothetical protein
MMRPKPVIARSSPSSTKNEKCTTDAEFVSYGAKARPSRLAIKKKYPKRLQQHVEPLPWDPLAEE